MSFSLDMVALTKRQEILNILVEGCSRWSYKAGGKEETNGCGKRGHADSLCERRFRGQRWMKEDDWLLLRIQIKLKEVISMHIHI